MCVFYSLGHVMLNRNVDLKQGYSSAEDICKVSFTLIFELVIALNISELMTNECE